MWNIIGHHVEYHRAPDAYREAFNVFLDMMKEFAFQAVKLNRIYTETYDIRPDHIGILENNGFVLERRMREQVKIQGKFVDSLIHGITKRDYYAN